MSDKKFNFTPQKWTYFWFGHCSEDAISALIRQAEDAGTEFVQIVMGMMPAPGSKFALPGDRPQMVPVVRLFVRCLESQYKDVVANVEAQNAKARGVPT